MSALIFLAQAIATVWSLAFSIGIFGQILATMFNMPRAERVWRAAARIHQELWLFAPPGLLVVVIQTWNSDMPFMIVFQALTVYGWWVYRDWPDENRWKRRGRKLKDAIAVRAGKLVIVPQGS